MTSILALDPGESTGWVFRNRQGQLSGGTLPKDHVKVAAHIAACAPDIIVIERFNLYPGMAKSLAWNSFYPCEVIGVVRYLSTIKGCKYIEQAPSVKKYAGPFQDDWTQLKKEYQTTEHTKDAYQHLKYFLRNGGRKYNEEDA